MDWLRQLPLGQYVAGSGGWLRLLDPRLKFAWSLAFLLTPVLAGVTWRLALVGLLLLVTLLSGLPLRLWRRTLPLLLVLSLAVGLLAAVLPSPRERPQPLQRPPHELQLAQPLPPPPTWELWKAGPLRITRRSAQLGVNSATLLFTVLQSANLLLVSTAPEALAWGLTALLAPLRCCGVPTDRLGFQLLLALRFLPLVQEELQNLMRAVATRAVNLRQLGWRAGLGLVLGVAERLLANLLLRAEQGAQALLARGGQWLPAGQLHRPLPPSPWLNGAATLALAMLLALRLQVGGGR